MSYPFQVAALVSSPLYPNSISWSEENLIAVATDNIVAILNPEQPHSPRGIITPTPGKVLSVGTIDRKDLLSGCLLPTCLSRDQRPCVRSISWSPVGFAPNSGCLLAVCTTEGRVKIYRLPYCEFQAEWAETIDVTEMFHGYLVKTNYGEPDVPSSIISDDSAIRSCTETYSADKATSSSTRQCKRKRDKDLLLGNQLSNPESVEDANAAPFHAKCVTTVILETALFPSSIVQEGTSVEVFKLDGRQHVWIVGRLESLDGSKALILFPERDANGKQEWFEMDPGLENFYQSHGLDIANGNNFPKIRPSMNAGNLPRELFLSDCHIVSEILKVGQAVEAWTNDRWVEGFFAGFHDGGFRFRALGDDDAMTLDASFVRLAPSWVKEEKLWKVTLVRVHIKDKNFSEVIETRFDNMKENYLLQIAPAPKVKMKHSKRTLQNCSLQLITACQYAARSALLASFAVAWSPELQLSQANPNNSCNCFCLLAVGAKSGKVSVWRIHKPEHYSVEHASGPTKMMLVGVFQVHNAWVTALGWEILVSDGSNPQLLLATGSSDGSVKIWLGYGADLQRLTEANPAPFSLLMEVAPVHPVPVSVLSLTVPLQFRHKVLLAIGKGSGSFEICTYDIRMKNLKKVGSFDVHDYAVTGLAWAFEGCCLYSCSKDNSLRCWIFHKGSFSEVPIPPNNLGIRVRSPTDLPCVYDSCFGVAVSPGNLAIALVRSFDPEMLNPMYQARSLRAAIEFFWIGGQQLNIPLYVDLKLNNELLSGFSEDELLPWGINILWSLNQFERCDKHLVVWDIMAASMAFKQFAPRFIYHILSQWLPNLLNISSDESRSLSNVASRKLHLINIVCRRVFLSGTEVDKPDEPKSESSEEEKLWMQLLMRNERELRERLVGFSLSSALCVDDNSAAGLRGNGCQDLVGIPQMVQWVRFDRDCVRRELDLLGSEVGRLTTRHVSSKKRLQGLYKCETEEQCSYCSAPVQFESPEFALCRGQRPNGGDSRDHKLLRCSVSMRVCPVTPTWFCVCCRRRASKLAPHQLYMMPGFPVDFMPLVRSENGNLCRKPLCPLCGILMQRSLPAFLLSPSPV